MSKIQVNEIVNHFDNGAPDCPKGLTITGVVTATTFSGSVETLNIDSVGIITAQSGVHFGLVGSGVTIDAVGAGTSMGFFTDGSEALRIDSSGNLRFNSGYGSAATAYGCRAWVNFDGSGTVAIRESRNVSSITDDGTGQYTVNFTTAMPDSNYCALSASRTSSGTAIGCCSPVTYSTGSIAIFCSGEITSGGLAYMGRNFNIDHNFVNVAIFR